MGWGLLPTALPALALSGGGGGGSGGDRSGGGGGGDGSGGAGRNTIADIAAGGEEQQAEEAEEELGRWDFNQRANVTGKVVASFALLRSAYCSWRAGISICFHMDLHLVFLVSTAVLRKHSVTTELCSTRCVQRTRRMCEHLVWSLCIPFLSLLALWHSCKQFETGDETQEAGCVGRRRKAGRSAGGS